MSIFTRFFGKSESDDRVDDLVAGPKKEDAPALQVLFSGAFKEQGRNPGRGSDPDRPD